ncbi:cysteine protease ATG4B-like isoform X2 [Liolophura sinensis]|uniref:cysteine protease ATG4B-like isoform X2 n=1 Tax=Liolophura sinensis TaxID=3198878 RepID=UPI003158F22B
MDFADACMTYESGPFEVEDFPQTDEPVWLLGEQYSTLYDLDELRETVLSKIWLTYRKNFSAIGGLGPTSDTGWGCMLRCGQMMLAEALVRRHLGKKWRWRNGQKDDVYKQLLRLFQDKKKSCFSIHQIAAMGVSEGKAIGHWFGPNTVAQVLRKLAVYDEWGSLAIHVAMDNTVIEEDIRAICLCPDEGQSKDIKVEDKKTSHGTNKRLDKNHPFANHKTCSSKDSALRSEVTAVRWKPLLLIIPLRLGLSEINSVYIDSLRKCLTLKQSVGIIGGKPNHALWFIGCVGEEMVFLDPHTTQPFVDLEAKQFCDESFHCPRASRMKVQHLDPSIALGFYCGTEAEFNDLCVGINRLLIQPIKMPMFELHKERPAHWPPFHMNAEATAVNTADYAVVGDVKDSDDDFEVL